MAIIVGGVFAARRAGPARAVELHSHDSIRLAGTDVATGKHIDLAAFPNSPIVLHVWGSWCDGCRAEAPTLDGFVHGHPNVQFVGVDTQDTKSGAEAFYRRWGRDYPSIADAHGDVAARLAVQGTPTTFFLNRRHEIVSRIVGVTDRAGLRKALLLALEN